MNDPWLGGGTQLATPADIARALLLYSFACRLLAGLILGAWIAAHLTRPG